MQQSFGKRVVFQSAGIRRALGGAAVVATIVFVVGLLGTAGAAPTSVATNVTPVKYSAPYSGTTGATMNTEAFGCSAVLHFPVQPTFKLSTGQGRASVKADASSCGSTNTSSDAILGYGFLGNAFSPASSGKYHLTVTGKLTFSVSLAASAGSATQSAVAGYSVAVGFDYLQDVTNSTVYTASHNSGVGSEIVSGTYAHSFVNLTLESYLNVTLLSNQSYRFGVGFQVTVYAFATPGTSSASAAVNMATGGNRGIIVDIIVK